MAIFVMLNLFAMIRLRGVGESEYSADDKIVQLQKQNSQLRQQVAEIKATLGIGVANTTAESQGTLRHHRLTTNDRRLAGVRSVVASGSNTDTSGCFAFTSSDDDAALSNAASTANVYSFQVNSASCRDSNRCPLCYIATSLTALGSIVLRSCSYQYVGSSAISDQAIEYTFINGDSTYNLNVYFADSSGNPVGGVYKTISPNSFSTATCYAPAGTGTNYGQWLGTTQSIR